MKVNILFLIISQVISLIAFPCWIFIAIFAPMLFDGGVDARTWSLFILCISMPVLIVIFSIILWVSYKYDKHILQIISASFLTFSPLPLIIFSN